MQWELLLHSHLSWFPPCYKHETASRCFLPLSLGQKHSCFFTEIPEWEVSAQSSQNKMGYSLFNLINLIDLLPSLQSQLNDNLTETMEELQPPCCWQLHWQSQPAPQWEKSCGAELRASSPCAKPGHAGYKSNRHFNTWFWHCMSQYLISFWNENAIFTIYGIPCITQG